MIMHVCKLTSAFQFSACLMYKLGLHIFEPAGKEAYISKPKAVAFCDKDQGYEWFRFLLSLCRLYISCYAMETCLRFTEFVSVCINVGVSLWWSLVCVSCWMLQLLTVYEFITVMNRTQFPLVTSAAQLRLLNAEFMEGSRLYVTTVFSE